MLNSVSAWAELYFDLAFLWSSGIICLTMAVPIAVYYLFGGALT